MNTLENAWDEVLPHLGYPNIPFPLLTSNPSTAFINMQSKQIEVNPAFIKRFNNEYDALKAVLAHEANHHVTFPYDLPTNTALSIKIKEVTNNQPEVIANYYSDVVINLDLVNRGFNNILNLYTQLPTSSTVDGTIKALYEKFTKTNLNVNKSYVNNKVLDKLKVIDYFDLELDSLLKNSKPFAHAIKDLFTSANKEAVKGGLIDRINKEDYSDAEISRAIEEAIPSLSPSEYLRAKGRSNESLKHYYDVLSKKYSIRIKNVKKNHVDISSNYFSWEPGMNINNIDLLKSNGKIFPNRTITKEVKYKQKVNDRLLPDSVIMIDSSGSMVCPSSGKSSAVIGAYTVANHYLNRGKKVGVVNFSNATLIQKLSDDKELIKKKLINYQNGITQLDMPMVFRTFKDQPVDYYMITDMGVFNLDDVYKTFKEKLVDSRISIISIDGLRKGLNKGNVKTYNVKDEKDIPRIVIKDLGGRNGL